MDNQLTKEQKQQIVALYWGQNLLSYNGDSELYLVDRHNIDCNFLYLNLRPLSTITDEDALQVAFKYGLPEGCEAFKVYSQSPTSWVSVKYRRPYQEDELSLNEDGYKYFEEYITFSSLRDWQSQYLIQQGYAVPLFIAPNHPLNGKDAIQLGLAIEKETTL